MKTSTQLCSQILALARSEQWDSGTHLAAQGLADRLRVSRQPVNEALQQLEEQGVVRRERNRGFFLALPHDRIPAELLAEAAAGDQDRSEEHTSELQSPCNLVCRLLLEKKKERVWLTPNGHVG